MVLPDIVLGPEFPAGDYLMLVGLRSPGDGDAAGPAPVVGDHCPTCGRGASPDKPDLPPHDDL